MFYISQQHFNIDIAGNKLQEQLLAELCQSQDLPAILRTLTLTLEDIEDDTLDTLSVDSEALSDEEDAASILASDNENPLTCIDGFRLDQSESSITISQTNLLGVLLQTHHYAAILILCRHINTLFGYYLAPEKSNNELNELLLIAFKLCQQLIPAISNPSVPKQARFQAVILTILANKNLSGQNIGQLLLRTDEAAYEDYLATLTILLFNNEASILLVYEILETTNNDHESITSLATKFTADSPPAIRIKHLLNICHEWIFENLNNFTQAISQLQNNPACLNALWQSLVAQMLDEGTAYKHALKLFSFLTRTSTATGFNLIALMQKLPEHWQQSFQEDSELFISDCQKYLFALIRNEKVLHHEADEHFLSLAWEILFAYETKGLNDSFFGYFIEIINYHPSHASLVFHTLLYAKNSNVEPFLINPNIAENYLKVLQALLNQCRQHPKILGTVRGKLRFFINDAAIYIAASPSLANHTAIQSAATTLKQNLEALTTHTLLFARKPPKSPDKAHTTFSRPASISPR